MDFEIHPDRMSTQDMLMALEKSGIKLRGLSPGRFPPP